ncbi:hypothetical protein pipiens_000626, partial [Culex pipiens pipiens]
ERRRRKRPRGSSRHWWGRIDVDTFQRFGVENLGTCDQHLQRLSVEVCAATSGSNRDAPFETAPPLQVPVALLRGLPGEAPEAPPRLAGRRRVRLEAVERK